VTNSQLAYLLTSHHHRSYILHIRTSNVTTCTVSFPLPLALPQSGWNYPLKLPAHMTLFGMDMWVIGLHVGMHYVVFCLAYMVGVSE